MVGGVGEERLSGLGEYGISARMFNAVRVSLEGKVASIRAQQKLRADGLTRRIARAERQIVRAEEHGRRDQVHQKKRRLVNILNRLAALESDISAEKVRLCFGSKRLWRKQHDLGANGYSSREEWLKDWRTARSDEFFVLGSRMKQTAASSALPVLLKMARWSCGSGCRTAWPDSMANTWSSKA